MGAVALAVTFSGLSFACSSDDGGDAVGPAVTTASAGAAATAADDGTAAATSAGDPAAGGPATTDLAGYYESIGVAPDVADCYARELEKLGITEVGLLETDPEKSAAAAGLFDACVADPTGSATSSP